MKRINFSRIIFTVILGGFLIACLAQSGKVIKIYQNGEVVKEFPIEAIDYVEVVCVNDEESGHPNLNDYDKIIKAMTDSIDNIYCNLAAGRTYSSGRFMFQRQVFLLEELPSDEAKWLYNDRDGSGMLNFGQIRDSDEIVSVPFIGLMQIIKSCNDFINADFRINYLSDNLEKANAIQLNQKLIREAKILHAAAYYYLINEFGNVPYSDWTTGSGRVPTQLSTDFTSGRRAVTEKVVRNLEDMIGWYLINDPLNLPDYGHVGLDVAESLLVKFYLNYEVFCGVPAWNKCLSHCKALIHRRGKGGFNDSGLAMNYHQNFSPSNRTSADNEILWRIATKDASGNDFNTFSNGYFMIAAFLFYSDIFDVSINDYNSETGWKCIVTTRQCVDAFQWNSDYTDSPDMRTNWWITAKHGLSLDNVNFDWKDFGSNGFVPIKFSNWIINDDGSVNRIDSPKDWQMFIDYGMIRLAEIYLSGAEAILRGGGGDMTEALKYVNYVRERAGMPAYTTLTLEELEKERQRELYTECNRRTDLIRYGKWISGYNWDWKGRVKEGTDLDPNFIVYPLPASEVKKYGYTQNPRCPEPDPFDMDFTYHDDEYIYLVGSPQGWTAPEPSNINIFKPYRLKNTYKGSKIFKGTVTLPASPEFSFYWTLNGWDSQSFGNSLNNSDSASKYYSGELEMNLAEGKDTIKLPRFTGGKVNITIDMTDEKNIKCTLNDRSHIYIVGNITNPANGVYNNWTAPSIENTEFYENFKLFNPNGMNRSDLYIGTYILDPRDKFDKWYFDPENPDSHCQFRFFTSLQGWTSETSIGSYEADFYVLPISTEFEEGTYSGNVSLQGLGNWGIYCKEDTLMTVVVDLRLRRIYVHKGEAEVTFNDRTPIFN